MQPQNRRWILTRTRSIIRKNLPQLEDWLGTHADIFRYVRPVAGAITYVEYDLPVTSSELTERIRAEQSVLLVPGDMFGLGAGIRFGYGFDIEHTLKGLARVDEVLADIQHT
jgi:DNA-binding transcriptional MocR family regulator